MIIVAFLLLFAIVAIVVLLILSIIFFVKNKKILGFTFLGVSILIPFLLYVFYLLIIESTKPNSLLKSEISSALKRENIKLKNNYSIIDSNGQTDLYYFRTEFTIKLSEEDYNKLKKNKSDTLKNIAEKRDLTYDTINIRLTKDKLLHFYRSQHDFNN